MGCICSKGASSNNDVVVDSVVPASAKESLKWSRPVEPEADAADAEPPEEAVEKENAARRGQDSDVPHGLSGEHVAAGWPSWLTSVAGEAIKGWLPRRADSFEKLDKIGQGTYSSVYRARDLETGKIVALKKVRFVNADPDSVRFMAREIIILRRLDHPNVLRLQGIVASRASSSLYLVFDYADHDLAGLAAAAKFTEPQIKCFMRQLLLGLDHCHGRGMLHRDIKGSNLLVDADGVLRIGDFGLAAPFNPKKKLTLTSRVVTLWYRPPELLLGATEYGVAVDLWSTGCIIAELLGGKPIMPGRTEVEQLHKIFKLCGSPSEDYWGRSKLSDATIFKPRHPYPRRVAETFRDFPASSLALLDTLLAIEPDKRGTAASALKSDFFTTEPLACDPSSLPKFPPSKEYDVAKLRNEETRRQREAKKLNAPGSEFGSRKTGAKPTQDESTESQVVGRSVSIDEENVVDDSGSGFPIDPRSGHDCTRGGSTMHPGAYGNPRNVPQLRSGTSPRCNRLEATGSSENSTHKKDIRGKNSTMGYGGKNRMIHYSGPLMPTGGNIEDMLKEHERQIQQAVRKARLEKTKSKKDNEANKPDTIRDM